MRVGDAMRITKAEWYRLGGFQNSNLFRKGTKRGGWTYWMLTGWIAN
jgi:hypothetical protein